MVLQIPVRQTQFNAIPEWLTAGDWGVGLCREITQILLNQAIPYFDLL